MQMDKASVTRVVAAIISLVAYFGINVPEGIDEYVIGAVMLGVTLWGIWKNNYLARKGKKQKEVLERHDLK